MDLSFLDKSSSVTPALVRLYDSHRLYGLAKDKKPVARAELTSAVTDLLEMKLTQRESDLIADVMIELLRQAETDLRALLAERLAVVDNVPLRVILQIAHDDIEVARPVLKNSNVLGDLDLIYIVKSKGNEYWQAIAARSQMSDEVMNVLADTRDFDTAVTLAENMNITLTEHTLMALSDLAQESDVLARPLLRREEVTTEIADKLYRFVGNELKSYIRENYDLDTGSLIDTVEDVVLELVDAVQDDEFIPTEPMIKAAERYKKKGLLTVKLMLGTLRRGQIAAFIAQFSRFSGMDIDTVRTVLSQPNGQGLAVACKAFSLTKEDFVSIFLLTNRVRNQGAMVDLKDMTKAVNYFNRIKPEVARGIVTNSVDGNLEI